MFIHTSIWKGELSLYLYGGTILSENIDVNPTITGGVDALTLVAGMAGKPVVETLLSPYIGNGTMKSGIIKVFVAGMANKYIPGKVGNAVAIATGADGAEDLILSLTGKNATAQRSSTSGVDF